MLSILFYFPDILQRIVVKLSFGVVSDVVLTLIGPFQVLTFRVNSTFVIECTTIIACFLHATIRLHDVISFTERLTRLFEFSKSLRKFVCEFVNFSIRSLRTVFFRSQSLVVERLKGVILSLWVLTNVIAYFIISFCSKCFEIKVLTEGFCQHILKTLFCAILCSLNKKPRVAVIVRALWYREVASVVGEQEVELCIFLYLIGRLRLIRHNDTCLRKILPSKCAQVESIYFGSFLACINRLLDPSTHTRECNRSVLTSCVLRSPRILMIFVLIQSCFHHHLPSTVFGRGVEVVGTRVGYILIGGSAVNFQEEDILKSFYGFEFEDTIFRDKAFLYKSLTLQKAILSAICSGETFQCVGLSSLNLISWNRSWARCPVASSQICCTHHNNGSSSKQLVNLFHWRLDL